MGINQIQTGRFNRLFQKFFSIKGPANVTEVGAEVLPVFVIPFGVEHRYLEGWDLFSVNLAVTGGAGQFGALEFRNPVVSNVMAVIEKIASTGTLADSVVLQLAKLTTDLATIVTLTAPRLDSRGRASATLIASSSTNYTIAGQGTMKGGYPANGTYDFILSERQEIPLLPGDAITIVDRTVAQTIDVTFRWRERSMEESELK